LIKETIFNQVGLFLNFPNCGLQDSALMNLERRELISGVVAGIAASIMSIGFLNSALLSIVAFFLSPLPIMLVGFISGIAALLIAVLTSMLLSALLYGIPYALTISMIIIIPAASAIYMFCTQRNGKFHSLPIVLIAMSVLAGFGVALQPLIKGYDAQSITAEATKIIEFYSTLNPELTANDTIKEQSIRMFISFMPFLQSLSWLLVLMGNFYIALRIAHQRNKLPRAWENWVYGLHMPKYTVGLLVLSVLGWFFSSFFAPFAGAFALLLTVSGFSFIHVLTQGKSWQFPALLATYFAAFFIGISPIFLFIGIYRSVKFTSTH
jgi:MFS family permease